MTEDEKILFQQAMRGVKPLKNTPKRSAQSPRPLPPLVHKRSQSSQRSHTPAPPLSDAVAELVTAEAIVSYQQVTLPKKRWQQLRTGAINLTAHLDLHGLSSEHARAALCSFISQQYQRQHRCLLIIHGKGGRHHEAPVLKNLVPHWLKQLPEILAFHSAQPKDGGAGALYVLLKKPR